MRRALLLLTCLSVTCAHPEPVTRALAQTSSAQRPSGSVSPGPGPSPAPPPAVSATPTIAPAERPVAAGPLSTFFGALGELRSGKRKQHVHIVWLGDSHTNADFLSGSVRAKLSEVFGDGGPGFVRVGVPYRHDGIKLGRVGSWQLAPNPPARRAPQDDGVFGLSGMRATPEPGASASVQVTTAAASATARFEIAYQAPAGSELAIELGPVRAHVGEHASGVARSGIAHLALEAPLGSLLSVTALRGTPRLFGVAIERLDRPGIVLDTLGIDGARIETALAWNADAFSSEVALRAPELIVVAYGTNEAFDALNVEKYRPQLAELVRRARGGTERASCLVLGPPDAGLGPGGVVPRVAAVTDVLARGAVENGCSFISLQRLMGGEGSFVRGMKAKERLAQTDRLHLTAKGYQELGAVLAQLLLDAYSRGRADLP